MYCAYPQQSPGTNFPIAVVDVAVKQVCFSSEDGYLASWLCGTENLSGKLAAFMSASPGLAECHSCGNGREYEALTTP